VVQALAVLLCRCSAIECRCDAALQTAACDDAAQVCP
jgi:hypothetical protein